MLQTRDSVPSRRRRFVITFVLFLVTLTLWSAAIPMFGAADENQHMLAAYGIVHGQGRGQVDPATGSPTFLAPHGFPDGGVCWGLRPLSSANCGMPSYSGPRHRVVSMTSTYPPYYYVLVGWPTLIASGRLSLYLMRFVSAMLVAFMMALALDTLARVEHPGPLVLGLAVALVPLAYFFGAAVNPSGLAIAATLAAWTGGILLVRGDPPSVDASAVARFAGPLCVSLLLRRDSLYWGGLLVLVLFALTPWSRTRLLARSRAVWIGAGAVGLSTLISLVSGGGSASSVGGPTRSGSFWSSVGLVQAYLRQLVGILGWLETYLPFPAYVLVQAMVAFLVIAACFFASRRLALVTAGITAVVVLVPVIIGTIDIGYFQGRYEAGFAAGVPLVAALAIGEQLDARNLRWPKRAQAVGLIALALVQFMSYAQMLRRYSAGALGQWWIFARPSWTPPYGSLSVLTVLFVVATIALYGWIFLQSEPEGLGRFMALARRRPSDQIRDIPASRPSPPPSATPAPDEDAVLAELESWGLKRSEGAEPPSGGAAT